MKKNTAIGIAAVAVAGALTIGLGAVSSWYTNWDVTTWFGRGGNATTQPENPDITPDDVNGDGAVITVGKSNGISLTSVKLPRAAYAANGVSAHADSAYSLTAVISPSDATDKTVDWLVSWADANSAWATGKTATNYVSVNPTEDGSLVASVECRQAFGEQIIITCRSRSNPDVSAVCAVDYTQKILSANLACIANYMGGPTLTFNESGGVTNIFLCGYSNVENGWVSFIPSKINVSEHTIADEYTWKITMRSAPEVWDHHYLEGANPINGSYEMTVYENGSYLTMHNGDGTNVGFTPAGIAKVFGSEAVRSLQFYNMLAADEIKNTYGCVVIESVVTGQYSSYTHTYLATFEQSKFSKPAANVTLNNNNIIF